MTRILAFHGVPNKLIGAIALLFLLFVSLIVLVPVQIIVPGYRLTTGFKVAYNIVSAVIATVIARFAASEIQNQWLWYINHEISDVKYQLPQNPGIAARWRAVLGLSTFVEGIKNVRTTGLAQLSTVATALITAAIVAAVTLTDTTCSSEVTAPRIHSGADNGCTRNVANNNTQRSSPLWEFRTFWNRDNGSAYFATTNLGCPSWSGGQNLGDINTVDPANFAYATKGVAVKNSAIGAPEILYTDLPKLVEPLEHPYGHLIMEDNLRTVSHCLPIMARNPIKCHPGGIITYQSSPGNNSISIDVAGCAFTQVNSEDPNGPFGVMISRVCPTQNAVGQATVAIGATGIVSLTLAAAMGDQAFLTANAGKYDGIRAGTVVGLTYSASCSIDVHPTIEWRTVTLELDKGTFNSAPSYSKVVTAVKGCSESKNRSAVWSLGDGYAAGAVAALVPPLSEGRFWNGMTNTVFNVALNVTDTSDRYSTVESWEHLIRKGPYGFNESANALEDVLGLTSGITMSQMSTIDSMLSNSPLFDSVNFTSPIMGNATFSCTRVGSGEASALMFSVPPLLALSVAVYLLCIVPRQATNWKTSRLEDLIMIGQASERERNMAYSDDRKRKSAVNALGALSLDNLWGAGAFNHDRRNLVVGAALPAGWSRRWVTDAGGTRAISVREGEEVPKEMDGGWTTGLPMSPVTSRYDDSHAAIDRVN